MFAVRIHGRRSQGETVEGQQRMFTNKYYGLKLSILIIWILSMCSYSHLRNPGSVSLQDCLEDPERFDKVVLTFGTNSKAGKVKKDRFELITNDGTKVTVFGSAKGLRENEYIDLETIFHKEGYFELKKIYVRKLRRLKIILSILPVLLVAWLFFTRYKFNLEKMRFVEK